MLVKEICYGLRFIERDGKKILQAKWLPIALDANMALTPGGKPEDWADVPLQDGCHDQ